MDMVVGVEEHAANISENKKMKAMDVRIILKDMQFN